ncbi:uncharacterized protein F5Z01DRAFT_335443 [Emericellopsis atlantica]|uniref:Uncharacterized protein n=1 Tax=Emericellopsis atlantica TaxID=2614577 RepID=A0A9P7ZFA3_9HYPO|nr:uncharacterized protein F5Z01DRAFT_335443 [Emericellopsis atlantica]KAG9250886.1 hypothetical protein F5Z01DRAFT_335443 [Emericellopsis atlantica]
MFSSPDTKDQECNFLFDFQIQPPASEHEPIPWIWYTWSGQSLAGGFGKISPEKKNELEHSLWDGKPFPHATKGPDGKYDPLTRRNIIMSYASSRLPLHKHDIHFLREHPGHVQWIKDQLKLQKQARKDQPSQNAPSLKGPDKKYDPLTRRNLIMSNRGFGLPLSKDDLNFLAEFPEHAQWIKDQVLLRTQARSEAPDNPSTSAAKKRKTPPDS